MVPVMLTSNISHKSYYACMTDSKYWIINLKLVKVKNKKKTVATSQLETDVLSGFFR